MTARRANSLGLRANWRQFVLLVAGEGKPSRWNTLRAMRVLDWYEHGPVR
jgi:hypothetical protein